MRDVEKEYGGLQETHRPERLAEMLSFRRSKDWGIRKFRRKYRQIKSFAQGVGVTPPEDVAPTQSIKS